MSEKFGSSAAAKNFHAERQNCLTTFLWLGEVADLKALTFNLALMFI